MKQGWEVKKISQMFNVKSSHRVHQSDWQSIGIPFYRAREVVKLARDGIVENELFISQELYDKFTQEKGAPKAGDIIVSAVGTLGQCYLVKDSDKFYFKDASVLWFENLGNINSKYAEYAFKSDLIMKQVMNGSMGATVGTLTIGRAKDIEIPVPPLPEQERIVSILDKAFSAIDQAKQNAEKNLKNAKELFDSYLNGIFTNKGEDWEGNILEEVAEENCSLSYGIVQPGEDYPYGLHIVRPTDLTKLYIRLDGLKRIDPKLADGYKRTKLIGDELLLCVRGTTGLVSIATLEIQGGNVTRGIVPIRFNSKLVSQEFGYYLLISNYVQKQIIDKTYGTALMQINIGDLRNVLTTYPSLKKQQTIVRQLDNMRAETKNLEEIYQQKIIELEDLKKSILQKAFNGEL